MLKIEDLSQGEIYHVTDKDLPGKIILIKYETLHRNDKETIGGSYISSMNADFIFVSKSWITMKNRNIRKANILERYWLETCIRLNSYISFEDAKSQMDIKVGDYVELFYRGIVKYEASDYSEHLDLDKSYKVTYVGMNNVGGDKQKCIKIKGCPYGYYIPIVKFKKVNPPKESFIVGKWYKVKDWSYDFYLKFQRLEKCGDYNKIYGESVHLCRQVIYMAKDCLANTKMEQLLEPLKDWSEIYQYLPNDHPDKVMQVIPKFYIKYSPEFTEDLFNHFFKWGKIQFGPYTRYDVDVNWENFKSGRRGYLWVNPTDIEKFYYSQDNNSQLIEREFSLEDFKNLIGYKEPTREEKWKEWKEWRDTVWSNNISNNELLKTYATDKSSKNRLIPLKVRNSPQKTVEKRVKLTISKPNLIKI